MTTVAVIASSTPLGLAVLDVLDVEGAGGPRAATTLRSIDLTEPPMPLSAVEHRSVDLRNPSLDAALDGADVVVLCPPSTRGADDDTRFSLRVEGTRNVLAAAGRAGARKLVVVSSATVYGARADNPVPLDEGRPRAADPGVPSAWHASLVEELVEAWAVEHPDVVVTVLRTAVVLGPGLDDAAVDYLAAPRRPVLRGWSPPVQFVGLDDVATAVALAVRADLPGPRNVAAEGWLEAGELSALLGRGAVAVPEGPAAAVLGALWRRRRSSVPPAALAYLAHPWVVTSARLRAEGWVPVQSNRELVRAFAAAHAGELAFGRRRVRVWQVASCALGASGAAAVAVARRRRRPREARGPSGARRPVR